MLKALFYRKRTAITYKSRVEPPTFSDFDRSPFVFSSDSQTSQPFTESSSRPNREQAVGIRDNGYLNKEKVKKEEPAAKEEVQIIDRNPIDGSNIDHDSVVVSVEEVSPIIPVHKDAVTEPEVPLQHTLEKVKKRKRQEKTPQDPFSIFDFLESDTDGTVELMKAKPVGLLQRTNSDAHRKNTSTQESFTVTKEKSTKKLAIRLKAESKVAVDNDDGSQSELSDFEPFADNNFSDVSYAITPERELPASDPREAELSSFMRQEFGMETEKDESMEEQPKKPSKRKQYVPQNKIKAQFTYGSARKVISCQNETSSEGNTTTNPTANSLSSNEAPVSANNTSLDQSKPLGTINISSTSISTHSSPLIFNNDMQLDEQNCGSKNSSGQNISQTTQNNVTDIFSVASSLSILMTWLSNIQPISCTTSISRKSAAGQLGDNVVAAQTLVAYLAQNSDGLNHLEHSIDKNYMVKVLCENIESCLDSFAEIDTLSSDKESSRAILEHSLNCLIIMEPFTASTHDITTLPSLCNTLLQILAVFQECTAQTNDAISALACSGVYTTLQQLINITYNNPTQCHIMTQELVLFDSIASSSCHTTMNLQGNWKDHFDQKLLSSKYFLPFHTAVLALGIMVNLFEGDQTAASQYSALVAVTCQGIGACAQTCTCHGEIPSSMWMYDTFKILASDETQQDFYKSKMTMYISVALGYQIQAGSVSIAAGPLWISSEDYHSIIHFISKFADLPRPQTASPSTTEAPSSTASAQLAAHQLVLQLKHIVKPQIL
ncbi:hypothetical protein BC943DRAFT_100515 [Umbelopsis sp. AD052]|nr:hypothetical protein BC943DRAFT_100515 [Umbelopsis sp. AD052]